MSEDFGWCPLGTCDYCDTLRRKGWQQRCVNYSAVQYQRRQRTKSVLVGTLYAAAMGVCVMLLILLPRWFGR